MGGTLWGCDSSKITVQKPPFLLLEGSDGVSVSYGVPLNESVVMTADHVWQKHDSLHWNEHELEVLLRDFDHNVVFLLLPGWRGGVPDFSDVPPALGNQLYRLDPEKGVVSLQVQAFDAENKHQVAEKVILDGDATECTSGSPIFDAEGTVYGVLVGADLSQKTAQIARIDSVMSFWEANQ